MSTDASGGNSEANANSCSTSDCPGTCSNDDDDDETELPPSGTEGASVEPTGVTGGVVGVVYSVSAECMEGEALGEADDAGAGGGDGGGRPSRHRTPRITQYWCNGTGRKVPSK